MQAVQTAMDQALKPQPVPGHHQQYTVHSVFMLWCRLAHDVVCNAVVWVVCYGGVQDLEVFGPCCRKPLPETNLVCCAGTVDHCWLAGNRQNYLACVPGVLLQGGRELSATTMYVHHTHTPSPRPGCARFYISGAGLQPTASYVPLSCSEAAVLQC